MVNLLPKSPIRTLLVDDEPDSLHVLKHMIQNHCSDEVEIVGESNDPRMGLELYGNLKPDLIFLDIDMPFMNGFEFLDKIQDNNKSEVVFTTAYDKYALQAFRTSAAEYLLKPIKSEDLLSALSKVRTNYAQKLSQQITPFLLQQVRDIEANNIRKIALPTSEGIEFLSIESIVYVESDDTYSSIYMEDGRSLFLAKTLGSIEQLLSEFSFIRVHRSFLISLKHITKVSKRDGGEIFLSNEKTVPISRSRKSLFYKAVKTRFPNLL